MTTKTQTIPASSTATGFAYTIELDTEISYVAISWFHDGEDQMVESSAPGGVLLACDVPVDDQALLATAVFELAGAPARARTLIAYDTGDALRDATAEEAAASDAALADPCGGGTGVIRVVHEGETISAYVEA